MRLEPANRRRWTLAIVVGVLLAMPVSGTASAPVRNPQFELAGLAKLEGEASFALLKEPELTAGEPIILRLGQSIGEYRLIAVEEDRVLLESPAGVITVTIGGSKGSPGAVAVAPAPKPNADARQAPGTRVEPPADPAAAAFWKALNPEPTMTAEESTEAALKGTPGGNLLEVLKNAFGLGTKPQ